jgi:hypothetical protein
VHHWACSWQETAKNTPKIPKSEAKAPHSPTPENTPVVVGGAKNMMSAQDFAAVMAIVKGNQKKQAGK